MKYVYRLHEADISEDRRNQSAAIHYKYIWHYGYESL